MPSALRRDIRLGSRLPSLLLVTGADAFSTRLIERHASSRRERNIAYATAPLTVSAAGQTRAIVGLVEASDRLSIISMGRLGEVPAVGRPVTSAIAISERDAIYWVDAPMTDEANVRLLRHQDGVTATLYSGRAEITHLTLAGQPDAPAAVCVSASGHQLVHFDPGGDVRTSIGLTASGVSGLAGSERHNLVAISFGPSDPGQLLDIATGETPARLGRGWRPLSWTSDGRYCLLAKLEGLQLLDIQTNTCRALPSARQPVFAASWWSPERRNRKKPRVRAV